MKYPGYGSGMAQGNFKSIVSCNVQAGWRDPVRGCVLFVFLTCGICIAAQMQGQNSGSSSLQLLSYGRISGSGKGNLTIFLKKVTEKGKSRATLINTFEAIGLVSLCIKLYLIHKRAGIISRNRILQLLTRRLSSRFPTRLPKSLQRHLILSHLAALMPLSCRSHAALKPLFCTPGEQHIQRHGDHSANRRRRR
jgi:hypothetical protein